MEFKKFSVFDGGVAYQEAADLKIAIISAGILLLLSIERKS